SSLFEVSFLEVSFLDLYNSHLCLSIPTSEMSAAESSKLVSEAGKSRAGDSRAAFTGSGWKLDRISMCFLPLRTIATAYLLIMFVSCGLAFLLILQAIEGVTHPLTILVAVCCALPVPFLIVGFIAVCKNNHGMAIIFEGYMIFLAVITLIAWTMLIIYSVMYYFTNGEVRHEPIHNPLLALTVMLFTLHACYIFYKFQKSLSARNS
ncbi:hypothetical protein PMAYCL1PPCAC_03781, partial [Pristionchus mayeri]